MHQNLSYGVISLLAVSILVGCSGGSSLDTVPVTGTVTWEGDPLEEGRITFRSLEGDRRSFSGKIKDGDYSVETFTGPMRVSIRASRIVPGEFDESNPDEKVPVGEMYIPPRYNSQSELTSNIERGENTVDFDLVSG